MVVMFCGISDKQIMDLDKKGAVELLSNPYLTNKISIYQRIQKLRPELIKKPLSEDLMTSIELGILKGLK